MLWFRSPARHSNGSLSATFQAFAKNPLKQVAEEDYLLITRSRGSTILLWSHGSTPILVRKDAIQLGRMGGSGSAAEGMEEILTPQAAKSPRKN
jgi:hypothetical protein